MDERYHNNDDDILHKSINMIWKLLDSQNKGVIDEQYYIYQLKMLDKIMNYNTNNNNGYSSKGNNNNSDELHSLHSHELEWRDLMKLMNDRSSSSNINNDIPTTNNNRYVGYEDFYNSWLSLAKNMESKKVIPYFDTLISILENENKWLEKSEGTRQIIDSNKNINMRKNMGKQSQYMSFSSTYNQNDILELSNTSNNVYSLTASVPSHVNIKLRTNTRRNITAHKIFSEWQERQSPRPTTSIIPLQRSSSKNPYNNQFVELNIEATRKPLENRQSHINNNNNNDKIFDITDKIVERALKMSFFTAMNKKQQDYDEARKEIMNGNRITRHNRTTKIRRRKIKSASAYKRKTRQPIIQMRLGSITKRPATSPLKQRRHRPLNNNINNVVNIHTPDYEMNPRLLQYDDDHTIDNSRKTISPSITKHKFNNNNGDSLLHVMKLSSKFDKKNNIRPRPATTPFSTRKNGGKIIKHSPSYNHFKVKRSHSISPTRFKRHTGEFFHVHQLSPRTSETMEKLISPRPPMSSRTRKQGRKHQKGRFVKKTDKNDEELQSYIQNKRLN